MGSPRQDAVATGADDDIIPDAARLDAHPDEPHHTGVRKFIPSTHPLLLENTEI